MFLTFFVFPKTCGFWQNLGLNSQNLCGISLILMINYKTVFVTNELYLRTKKVGYILMIHKKVYNAALET